MELYVRFAYIEKNTCCFVLLDVPQYSNKAAINRYPILKKAEIRTHMKRIPPEFHDLIGWNCKITVDILPCKFTSRETGKSINTSKFKLLDIIKLQ